ncbi:putative poly-gamma-glutamate hydrolase [Bacillus phage phiAGATE]|uniref:Poly-gamma-glutamate hydrolase n=1 Tax=Bacillus phage phiAGATE TaxID=1204533 RepID=L0LBX1_9CAUD|nr:poly-gamma-glutamate hydrolase [Bacillus phage phiAGATE]AGB62650.1 putative poly-gamma-glutamate hydrolase [Bacillus phage phiAGATE]
MADKYNNYAELRAAERIGKDYNIECELFSDEMILVVPHGGGIEVGTTELSQEVDIRIKNRLISSYLFNAMKPSNNVDLHITSANFDEPVGVGAVTNNKHAISFHGYAASREENTIVGGLDEEFKQIVIKHLQAQGFNAEAATTRFTGTDPKNIVNRCEHGAGVQLELSTLQRKRFFYNDDWSAGNRHNRTEVLERYASAIALAIEEYTEGRIVTDEDNLVITSL